MTNKTQPTHPHLSEQKTILVRFCDNVLVEWTDPIPDGTYRLAATPYDEQLATAALRQVLEAVNAYHLPDGIDAKEAMSRIIGIVDPWPVDDLPGMWERADITGGETDTPPAAAETRFSCYLERDFGKAPCDKDCGKLRCMYPSKPAAAEAPAVPEKTAPVQGWPAGIPWSLHLEAYAAYCKKWGAQPALINLEGRNCRGGFGTSELDEFIPGWRDRISEITKLREETAGLKAALAAQTKADSTEPKAVLSPWVCQQCGLNNAVLRRDATGQNKCLACLVSPAQAGKVAEPEDSAIDVSSKEARSQAWFAVVGALNKACPGWMKKGVSAMDSAVDAILALRPKAQPLTVKVLVRGTNEQLPVVGWYDDVIYVAHGIASPTKGQYNPAEEDPDRHPRA